MSPSRSTCGPPRVTTRSSGGCSPEEFVEHVASTREELGFAGVMAGPLVRSSYRAGRLYAQAMAHHGRELDPAMAHLADEGSTAQEASSLLERLAR
ncbi:MAG: hypothetical protein QM703_19155 [Gemmatales bacterium]